MNAALKHTSGEWLSRQQDSLIDATWTSRKYMELFKRMTLIAAKSILWISRSWQARISSYNTPGITSESILVAVAVMCGE